MTHMVIFQSSEGNPGYHQTESLDDAVRFVEGLRNDQNVDQARIFRMEEIPFEFQSYFRVELGKTNAGLRVRGFSLGESESIDLTAALADGSEDGEASETEPASDADSEDESETEPETALQFGSVADSSHDLATEFERDDRAEPVTSGFVARRGLFGR